MARKDRLIMCPACGEVNAADNVSCRVCLADLTGDKKSASASVSQLAHLAQLVKRVEVTNRRLNFLIGSIWLIFALYVGWTIVAAIMGVGGPGALFRWPF
ncbi:MAG TPA: hypothetical protein VLC48_02805 [Gemmatimonadota bacterium]|nr:hypothetical protein [Gemmatimonadota bacterium]